MDHDRTVTAGEVIVPVRYGAGTPIPSWAPGTASPRLDELADPMQDGRGEIADNVVLGYD